MSELELYKFVQDKEIRWVGEDHLNLWIDANDLQEFTEIEGDCITDDGGFEIHLCMGGTVCINLFEVCELHEINPDNILPRN